MTKNKSRRENGSHQLLHDILHKKIFAKSKITQFWLRTKSNTGKNKVWTFRKTTLVSDTTSRQHFSHPHVLRPEPQRVNKHCSLCFLLARGALPSFLESLTKEATAKRRVNYIKTSSLTPRLQAISSALDSRDLASQSEIIILLTRWCCDYKQRSSLCNRCAMSLYRHLKHIPYLAVLPNHPIQTNAV